MAIPLFDPGSAVAPLRPAILEKLPEVLAGSHFILGPEVEAFEREFADYLGVGHVIGVANGTDAITIALRALGVTAGDEVVVPALTFYASAEAAVNAGARPVFCDVDPDTRNVTVDSVRAALTPATKAIIAVDLFGCPAPIGDLQELGLPVLEDAAQAAGASLDGRRAGALGDIATFSFYPSKNLGCFGDGGAVATDDDELAEMVRALRFHGSRDKVTFEFVGYNSRLDELQAAILRVLLPELDTWSDARRRVGRTYADAGLGDHVRLPRPQDGADPAWHLYVIAHERADELRAALAQQDIQARGYYRTPLHHQTAMAPYTNGNLELPVTEELARTNLALPLSPVLSDEQVHQVVRAVAAAGL
jgi:dTDP-4-amino-4,6-dideoxygalactose transaminase